MSQSLDADRIAEAAALLAEARRSLKPLNALPTNLAPKSFLESEAIQRRTQELLGETVSAYKVNGTEPGTSTWAGIMTSLFRPSPAGISAAGMAPYGIEAEIAFRLDRTIAASEKSWTPEQLAGVMTGLPVIELVATRFVSIPDTPAESRNADFMSNGALVCGALAPGWRSVDLTKLHVCVTIAGNQVAETIGGHAAGDPRIPLVAFLNAPHRNFDLLKGQVITTGSLAGMPFARPGDDVSVTIAGFGEVRLSLS